MVVPADLSVHPLADLPPCCHHPTVRPRSMRWRHNTVFRSQTLRLSRTLTLPAAWRNTTGSSTNDTAAVCWPAMAARAVAEVMAMVMVMVPCADPGLLRHVETLPHLHHAGRSLQTR